jgi:hypothetical protein
MKSAITISIECRDSVRESAIAAIGKVQGVKNFIVTNVAGGVERVINCTKIELTKNGQGFNVEARRGGGWYGIGYWTPCDISE